MPNVITRTRERVSARLTPGGGKVNKLLEQQQTVNAQIASLRARLDALRAHERALLSTVNGPAGADPLGRLVAQEQHRALRPEYERLDAELNHLGARAMEVTNHLQPLLQAVSVYRRNLEAAAHPPAGMEVSLAARASAWTKASLALHGLIGLEIPRKMPNADEAWLLARQANEQYSRMLYPANRETLTSRGN